MAASIVSDSEVCNLLFFSEEENKPVGNMKSRKKAILEEHPERQKYA